MKTLLNCKIFLKQSPVLIECDKYRYMFDVLSKEKYFIESIDHENQTAKVRKQNNTYKTKTIDLLETYVFPYVVTPDNELHPLSISWQSSILYSDHTEDVSVNIENGAAEKFSQTLMTISVMSGEGKPIRLNVTEEQRDMLEDLMLNNPHVRLTEL